MRILSTLAICLSLNTSALFANETGGIEELEQKLLSAEKRMLDMELNHDKAIVENWRFRGILGWLNGLFSGAEKRAVEALLLETEQGIRKEYAGVKDLESSLQKEVFDVAYAYEMAGDFEKAIEFYKKVVTKDDKVHLRIGTCYQKLGDFSEAANWYLKLSPTDANFLYLVDCYWEGGQKKEAISWLFRILEPYHKNEAELKALTLMDEYDYPNRNQDFLGFMDRLSDVYLAKAMAFYTSEFETAASDYRRAVEIRAGSKAPAEVSREVVASFRAAVEEARRTLEEKREEAFEHYEYQLRQAEQKISQARDRLRDAERQAYRDYDVALERTRRELSEARLALEQLKGKDGVTPEQLDYADKRLRNAEYRLQDLMNNRQRFIDDEIRPYQQRVDRAQREYNQLVQDRAQIIENYIAPYKAKVKDSEFREQAITRLHATVFA